MLTNLESKLEEYLSVVDTLPAEFAEGIEKSREKERRKVRAAPRLGSSLPLGCCWHDP